MNIEGKQQSLLTFRVGPVLCCAPSLPVRSIITPPKLTHPPGSDSSQPGIFKHGSHIVKVHDLRQKFGINEAEQTHPGNLIITIFKKDSFAFWVDQILDVFDFPTEGWGNLPAALPRGVFTRTLLLNKKIHLYSEFEKLATINDLGYLKHYIRKLKEQEQKKTLPEPGRATASTIINETKQKRKDNIEVSTEKPIIKTNSAGDIRQETITTKVMTGTFSKKNTIAATNEKSTDKTINTTYIKTTTNRVKQEQVSSHPVSNTQQQSSINKVSTPPPKQTTNNKAFSYQARDTYIETEEDNKPSNFGVILFFIFMLVLLGAGVYYLLFSADDRQKYKRIPVSQKQYGSQNSNKTNKLENKKTSIPATKIKNNIETKTTEPESYRADISQVDNEITITIHKPASDEKPVQVIKPLTPEQIKEETKIEAVLPTTVVKTIKKTEKIKDLPPEIIIKEVIHIVVKGDTLWAIAKKYVNDPFLYPELARLSNIKNPHRIYPGNRVRIRFVNY